MNNPKKYFIYFGKKVIQLLVLLVVVMILTFVLMKLSPIDPVTAYVGQNPKVSAEQRALIAEKWGLNQPLVIQFCNWFKNFIRGDWGDSIIYRRPVMEVVGQKFLASLSVMFFAWILSGLFGFILGITAGVKNGKLADKIIMGYCHVLNSVPSFWLGIVFIIVFSVQLEWFPVGLGVPMGVVNANVSFGEKVSHSILPILTLAFINVSGICLHTREKSVDILNSEYVLFAISRGESQRNIVFNHLIRNVSLPAITLQFLNFSELFGGAVFIEQVFSYPGLGSATVQAGLRGDVPLLMGITFISVIFVFCGNTIADILYRIVDPRIREGKLNEF